VIRSALRSTAFATLAVVCAASLPAPAAAAAFRWTGAAALGEGWSAGKNWAGGVAPSGSVGMLKFEKLGGGCSNTQQSPHACYSSDDDLTGLRVGAISIEDTQGYALLGNAVTLGAGGLRAAPSTQQCPCGLTGVFLPIVLGADQTWSIDGEFGVTFGGKVTGRPHALALALGSGSSAILEDIEVGPVSFSGTSAARSGRPFLMLERRNARSEVNAIDREPVHLDGVFLRASRAAVGPLAAHDAAISGAGSDPPGVVAVSGRVKLDSRSEILAYVTRSGATPGKDYWQLRARGQVNLAHAHLILSVSNSKGFGPDQPCPKLARGTVETLIKTKRRLKSRFTGIHDGDKATITCAGKRPTVRIHYKKHAVTATVA
jgi:hypothetical protein